MLWFEEHLQKLKAPAVLILELEEIPSVPAEFCSPPIRNYLVIVSLLGIISGIRTEDLINLIS